MRARRWTSWIRRRSGRRRVGWRAHWLSRVLGRRDGAARLIPMGRRPRLGRHGALVPHELDAERAFGFELIVRAAAKSDGGRSGITAAGDFLHVIELDPVARFATTAVLA